MTPSALFARPPAAHRRAGGQGPVGLTAPEDDSDAADGPATSRTARARAVEGSAQQWRERLIALSGASALSDVSLLGEAVIDLTAAHPSGIAQLYSGRATRLSNLVREGGALVTARRSARTVVARTDELAQRYGVAPTYLAAGIATWTEIPRPVPVADQEDDEVVDDRPDADDASEPAAPRTVQAPVLLRPVRLTARGGQVADLDLQLEPAVDVNSVLVRALRSRGVSVDSAAIASGALTTDGFSPRAALARLALLGEEHLPDFTLEERVLIGPFVHPGQVLVDDLESMHDHLVEHDVVAALAGVEDARAALDRPLPERVGADRQPQAERGVGDLDPEQQRIVDAVSSGTDLFIDAPPGADVPATLAAVLADAVATGRRVLYVPGTRRVGRALVEELTALGLRDLVLDLSTDTGWRASAPEQLRAGLHAVEPEARTESVRALRAELVTAREQLAGYVEALHTVRRPWDCSAHAALQALAGLTAQRPGPRTEVRLSPDVVRELVGERREHARERLVRAASLGSFELRPHDTPWYGARLESADGAHRALERTQRLAGVELPRVLADVERTARETGLTTARTLRGWLEQLDMLDGVRTALDVFVPQVFERSAADMVVATSTRAWRKEHGVTMAGGTRRRLRKQAKDLLRPGRPVPDLHAELVHVQEQREVWRRHCPGGGWPRLPEGLSEMARHARAVEGDVAALQDVVGAGAGKADLLDLPLADLASAMEALGNDSEAVRLMPERTAVLAELGELGLGELVADLTARRVPAALAGAELDLAWWTSVLEDILRTDPALAGFDGPGLIALAERFRRLDAEHVETLTTPVRRAVVRRLQALVHSHREAAAELEHELGAGRGVDLRRIHARHPELVGAIRPSWVVPPVLVPQLLPPTRSVDLVVLDGVHHLPTEQAVGAIARGQQVVLVGDSRRGGDGLAAELAPLLPALTLPTDRAEREESIAVFLARHGYADVIQPVPAPPAPGRTTFEVVEGFGMPAPGADAVESVQAEVDRVVDLVIEHALTTPEQSLAVIALNARHADRVREAVISAVSGSSAVADFFAADKAEPFVVVDADGAAGLRRDTVVLSLGYAKTPHGRVLHSFGAISGPDGTACLIDALDAVRERLVLVSCIGPGDIDRGRLHQPGPLLLADLIDWAAEAPEQGDTAATGAAPDPLLVDLAERLWRLGLTVVPQYGVEGGVRIPLAIGHPDLPGELLVAVLTDDASYVAEPNLRRRERHWVQRLAARGWKVHMAFSTAVFTDPQGEAQAILGRVLDVVGERRRTQHPVRVPVAAPPVELEDTDDVADGDADASDRAHDGAVPGSAAPQFSDATQPAEADDEDPPGVSPDASVGSEGGRGPASAARERGPRPPVTPGLPIGAYSDDELDDLAAWIDSDGIERDRDALVAALREELGLTRRGLEVDGVLRAVASRRG
ncbi:hypothetical protein [Georgenia sp. H159]|uniref:hypothetical protein n=1 Tax=Georgenia sp. H159 TaxID=3076115 RepID=UPI002D767482|nr:hypothetical protein [Georgenia sp. H159]